VDDGQPCGVRDIDLCEGQPAVVETNGFAAR
jgi:hypothetical protein